MLEVLSPAGSNDALIAAVQNGADAVYLGYGSFNARMNAKNFSLEQLRQSVSYCHVRGVKVYLTLNTLVLDRELREASTIILEAARAGVDAILVQDFGVCQLVRQVAPDMAIHASTQMAVHNLAGVKKAAEMGISRVVLARELSRWEIAAICRESPIEVEVFVHGALCMCYSGQCYLSAMIGRRSGNRGQCAQPCRLNYGYDREENRYPLSLKDNCLVGYLRELEQLGVACVKIEGRMKRAEYVAIATKIYKNAALGQTVTPEQLLELQRVFSRQGFTDGYYTGKKGKPMYGTRQEEAPDRNLLSKARATYESTEAQLVPVWMRVRVYPGEPAMLYVSDDAGNMISAQGPKPELAKTIPLTQSVLISRLSKTGGTPFYVEAVQVELVPGLMLSASAINALRREALSLLAATRGRVPEHRERSFRAPAQVKGQKRAPVYTVEIQNFGQITSGVIALKPAVLYVPLHLLNPADEMAVAVCRAFRVAAVLPRVIKEGEWESILGRLSLAKTIGVREVLVGNIGMLEPVRRAGFQIRGDFGLNVFNSGSANYLASQGLTSLTASFELTLPQIRDLSKPIPTEIFAYGRLPLMITEQCIIHGRAESCICGSTKTNLVDRTGSRFPILRDGGTCRSQLYNSKKLYWGDKLASLSNLGLWALRLSFTTETEKQVDAVIRDYQSGGAFDPGVSTRGLYVRGVE
jgi:putative protease